MKERGGEGERASECVSEGVKDGGRKGVGKEEGMEGKGGRWMKEGWMDRSERGVREG